MKKTLLTIAAVIVSLSAFGQGNVVFDNAGMNSGDAPVTYAAGVTGHTAGSGAGAGVTAQLFLVGAGGSLTALTPTATFFTTPVGATPFINNGPTVAVPGLPAGSAAVFRIRAWDSTAASYDAAVAGNKFAGESNNSNSLILGGTPTGGGLPITPPALEGITAFTLKQVPEPSTIALGLIGGLALLFRRRK